MTVHPIRGGKTFFESVRFLSAELEALQSQSADPCVDFCGMRAVTKWGEFEAELKNMKERAARRAAHAARCEKISALLARVVRDMAAEPTRGVLLYDVETLLNGGMSAPGDMVAL